MVKVVTGSIEKDTRAVAGVIIKTSGELRREPVAVTIPVVESPTYCLPSILAEDVGRPDDGTPEDVGAPEDVARPEDVDTPEDVGRPEDEPAVGVSNRIVPRVRVPAGNKVNVFVVAPG